MSQSLASAPEMVQLEIRKGPDAEIEVGGLRFVACRREVGNIDGGITLYVWGSPAETGDQVELLRFDFFRDRPHYHAPAEKKEECAIDAAKGGSVAWGIQALTTRAPELALQAGFGSIGEALDVDALASAGPAIQSLFDSLEEPNEISYFEIPASVLASLRQ